MPEGTCPYGHKCITYIDDKPSRCNLLVDLWNHNDPAKPFQESKCAHAWQPILLAQSLANQGNQNHTMQVWREETLKRQDKAIERIGKTTQLIED